MHAYHLPLCGRRLAPRSELPSEPQLRTFQLRRLRVEIMAMHNLTEDRRLKQAREDAAAFSAEVRSVIQAQRHQIAVLERQAQQLANEAAAEQRFASTLVANDKGSVLMRLQQEHTALGNDLDAEGRRALDLATRLETLEAGKADLRTAASQLEQKRTNDSKGKKAPLHFKLQRTRSGIDEMQAAAGRLREEVDHLRREKLVFLGKLRDLEIKLEDERAYDHEYGHTIRDLSGKRDDALSHARQLSDQNERRSHQRARQRQQVDGQLQAVEKQARQVRSKLKQKMMSNSLAAASGGSALHKLRLKKAAWPPSNDNHGMLTGVPAPNSLREHVAVLAYLIGAPEDIEAICEKMAAEDRDHAGRTAALEKQRRELALQEETNEKGRQELTELESTGGVDTNEHRSLREQLTEMQAQGVAVRNAEERHNAVLEQLSAIGIWMLEQLDPEAAEELHASMVSGDALGALAKTLDRALTTARSRLPGA